MGDITTTAYETKVPNPNITWETATSVNFGFDLRTLNNRLALGFEVFKNSREDILTQPNKTLPNYSGITHLLKILENLKIQGLKSILD